MEIRDDEDKRRDEMQKRASAIHPTSSDLQPDTLRMKILFRHRHRHRHRHQHNCLTPCAVTIIIMNKKRESVLIRFNS